MHIDQYAEIKGISDQESQPSPADIHERRHQQTISVVKVYESRTVFMISFSN